MGWRETFRKLAKENRWDWTELARRTGIEPATLQNWLQPKFKGEPGISDAIKLADAMAMSLDELFRGIAPHDELARKVQQLIVATLAEERSDVEAVSADTAAGGEVPKSKG